MPYSMSGKCVECGHQRQHHVFPVWREDWQNRYNQPSSYPGCRIDHAKNVGRAGQPSYVVPLKTSAGKACPCEEFEE
jgi:hypothetical protein